MKPNPFNDAARAGLYLLPSARQRHLPGQAARAGLVLLTAEIGGCTDVPAALSKLGKDLDFPDWYGANLDALHDCLTEPDWQQGKGIVLLISGLESVRVKNPDNISTLIDVLRSAAETRSAEGLPFWILLTGNVVGITALPAA